MGRLILAGVALICLSACSTIAELADWRSFEESVYEEQEERSSASLSASIDKMAETYYSTRENEFALESVQVRWIRVTEEELDSLSRTVFGQLGQMLGLTIPPAGDNKCVILARSDIRTEVLQRVLGHEILHCFFGMWHPAGNMLQMKVGRLEADRSTRLRGEILMLTQRFFPARYAEIIRFLSERN